MREDSQAEIQARIKNDVIPNRAESPVRNLLFPSHPKRFDVESEPR